MSYGENGYIDDDERDDSEGLYLGDWTPGQHLAAYRAAMNIAPGGGLNIRGTLTKETDVPTYKITAGEEFRDYDLTEQATDLMKAEQQLADAEKRVDLLSRLALLGDDEVICWTRTFGSGSTYSYVALKANGHWYTTEQGSQRMSARTLTERLLHADEGSLLVVTGWAEL